jgi:hypothetical protein
MNTVENFHRFCWLIDIVTFFWTTTCIFMAWRAHFKFVKFVRQYDGKPYPLYAAPYWFIMVGTTIAYLGYWFLWWLGVWDRLLLHPRW